jgi:Putative peptidoglycan binding domain/CHAP domain
MNTPTDVINAAVSQIGVAEEPLGSNHVGYWDWIGRPDLQGNPWCAAFVTWAMLAARVPFPTIDTSGGFVYCPDAVAFAKRTGTAVNSSDARPGDVVLYDWEHDAIADHTGILVRWITPGVTFEAVEGNVDGKVVRVARPVTDVELWVRPPYAPVVTPSGPVPITQPRAVDWAAIARLIAACKTTVLREGSRGIAVGVLQGRLRDLGFNEPGMVDPVASTAIFGPRTHRQVNNFQRARGLVVDGIVGPRTWGGLFP